MSCKHCTGKAKQKVKDHETEDCPSPLTLEETFQFYLPKKMEDGGVFGPLVPVCRSIFRNTFGIGGTTMKRLAGFAKAGFSHLPKEAFLRKGGSKQGEWFNLCTEFAATVRRRYSHFSMTSETQYIMCAKSILQLYRGPVFFLSFFLSRCNASPSLFSNACSNICVLYVCVSVSVSSLPPTHPPTHQYIECTLLES